MRAKLISRRYALPFALITTLFFLWGFARAILDVLNKHFQSELSISITRSTMIQTVTYLGYFLMAIPAGIMITRSGYRRGVVTGLICFGVGALMFIPGAAVMSFPLFLTALFIIGCGLAMLETAANPYAAELGARETAASRLNLTQSFNGLGCIMSPLRRLPLRHLRSIHGVRLLFGVALPVRGCRGLSPLPQTHLHQNLMAMSTLPLSCRRGRRHSSRRRNPL